MEWLPLSILGGLFSSLHNYFNRYVLKDDEDSTSFGWLNETTRLILFLLLLPLNYFFITSAKTIFLLIFLGFVEVVSIYLFMKMHKYSHLSISSIISKTRLMWIALFALVFLKEKLLLIEYLGIAILFIGISIVISPKKVVLDKGVKLAFISAIAVAILSIIMKFVSSSASTPVIMVFMSTPSVFLIPLLMKSPKTRIRAIFKRNLSYKLLSSISNSLSMIFYVLALRIGYVGKVSAVYQSMVIFAVVAGIVFLKEREDILRKLLGAMVVIIGVFLISYF